MVLGDEVIKRGDIQDILRDDEVQAWLEMRRRYNLFGNPVSEGWMEWPAHWVDALEAMEIESDKLQEEKRQEQEMKNANR